MAIEIIETTDAQAQELFAADHEQDGVSGLTPIPDGIWRRLQEFNAIAADGTKVTLARDWEGCAFGLVEGDERFDVLSFSDDGRVGHGGINQPVLFDSFAELLGIDTAETNGAVPFTLEAALAALVNCEDGFDASIQNTAEGGSIVFIPFTDRLRGGPFAAVTIEGPEGDDDAFMVGGYTDYEDAGTLTYCDTPGALVEAVAAIRKELV